MSIINLGAGLSALGESVARTAGAMSLEALRNSLEEDRLKLANEMASTRESAGRREAHGFAKELQDTRLAAEAPEREARTRSLTTTTAATEAKERRIEAGIKAGQEGGGDRIDILNRARNAIAGIEQGPEGYASVGPETTYKDGSKDKPYGRYQVMGKNVAQWTKEALGREMTPDEFLKDEKAQDAVFNHRFGSYLDKYGNPQDAASAWFSGRPRSQAGNDKDVLGTSVPGYVAKFNEKFGSGGDTSGTMPPELRRRINALNIQGEGDKAAELEFRWAQEQNKRSAPTPGERERIALAQGQPKEVQVYEWLRGQSPEDQRRFLDLINEKKDTVETKVENGQIVNINKRTGQQIGKAVPIEGFTPAMNNEQARDAGFADRMTNSNGLLATFDKQGANAWQRLWGLAGTAGNIVKSEDYQKFEQAKRDFINAQLRRESGAAIQQSEFENADKQYFPVPGDTDAVIAQKAKNRQIALDGMIRSAGPGYKPPTPEPVDAGRQISTNDVLSQARDAIARGAPRDRVIERLRQSGIDPAGL